MDSRTAESAVNDEPPGYEVCGGDDQEEEESKEGYPPPELQWVDELPSVENDSGIKGGGGDDHHDDDDDLAPDCGKKLSFAETAGMFKLRRNLDQLDRIQQQKENDVERARKQVDLCTENIESLEEQKEEVEKDIELQKEENNRAALFHLQTRYKELCQKLQNEQDLKAYMNAELKQQELDMFEVEVELGRVNLLRHEVEEEERQFRLHKSHRAAMRLKKENTVTKNMEQKIKRLKSKQEAMQKKDEAECQKKLEDAQASHSKAAKYWKQAYKRMSEQAAENEQRKRDIFERRLKVVQALKSSIAANQENLRSHLRRAKVDAQKKELSEAQLKENMEAQGYNSYREMYQQRRLEEAKQYQKKLEENQRSKKLEIAAKLLEEEQLSRSRRKTPADSLKPTTTEKLAHLRKEREKLLQFLNTMPTIDETTVVNFRDLSDDSNSSSESLDITVEEKHEEGEDSTTENEHNKTFRGSLVEPEFSGLWDQDYEKLVGDRLSLPEPKKGEHAGNALAAKKALGKDSKTQLFISKPDVIDFKDFELSKTYRKKAILTNSSFSVNNCKLIGVSQQIGDFVSVNFKPPGPLSPGMSCEMHVIFQPMLNEDMEGLIEFTSILGDFFVPVKCTIKKCTLEVDNRLIDFGSHIVGQFISRTITLTNKGALSTFFRLDTTSILLPLSDQGSSQTSTSISQSDPLACEDVEPQQQQQQQQQLPSQDYSEGTQQDGTVSKSSLRTIPSVDTSKQTDSSESNDITLGTLREGVIGAFGSVKLEVFFTPTIPGESKLEFRIKFSDIDSPPIPIEVKGVAVSVPVWVTEPNIDLKICIYNRLYQDNIIVQSRASTPLRLIFEIVPEMSNHLEIQPKSTIIQGQSSFHARLRFIPKSSLASDAAKFFDIRTGVLEVPMKLSVVGQTQPVLYTIQAIVTSSDLRFDRKEVDFGRCSIEQAVRTTVHVTNMSLLPQDFGFTGIPEFIEVQPNDGFGVLLPQETLEIELIFRACKPKPYQFKLICKSGLNRDFVLNCRAIGIHPPLQLSHSVVQFRATAVGDQSTAVFYLSNAIGDQSKEKQRKISKRAAAAIIPRLFCFVLPKGADIHITPPAGRIIPGQKCLIQVVFTPKLSHHSIKEEALRRFYLIKMQEESASPEKEAQPPPQDKPPGKEESTKSVKAPENPPKRVQAEPAETVDIAKGSELYEEARTFLLCSVEQYSKEYTVPCFVSDGDPPEESPQVQPKWSPENILYMKFLCPAVRPPLVALTSTNQNTLSFERVVVGQKVIKKFTVQNISDEPLKLWSSVLNVDGPFSLLNALRPLEPGKKHTLSLCFSPVLEKKYCDILEVKCEKMVLPLRLIGEGVEPTVSVSPDGSLIDFGYTLEKETISQVLQLHNSSSVVVSFRVLLASQCSPWPQGGIDKVTALLTGYKDSQIHAVVGTRNNNGTCVFSVSPVDGSIASGQSRSITISFHPDHASDYFSDKLTVELTNKTVVCMVALKGVAKSSNMYLHGGDPLTVPIESLAPPLVTVPPPGKDVKLAGIIPYLVTLRARSKAGVVKPAVRELVVGCTRPTRSTKKGNEFYWDNMETAQKQGFKIDPLKGNVDIGGRTIITIKWTPQIGYKPFEVVQICLPLTLESDKTYIYNVTLMALVSDC